MQRTIGAKVLSVVLSLLITVTFMPAWLWQTTDTAYAADSYTVTFDTQGHGSVGNQAVNYGGTASRPQDPSDNGWQFRGWFTDPVKEYEVVCSNVNSAITISNNNGDYSYSEKVVATVSGNNVTVYSDGKASAGQISKSYVYDFSEPVYSNRQLYAHWAKVDYTVKFNLNGVDCESGEIEDQTGDYGFYAERPTDPVPVDKSWEFVGWSASSNATSADYSFETPVTANYNLYGVWKAKTYVVTFNQNIEGSVEGMPADITGVKYNNEITAPKSIPTTKGKTFAGWCTDKDCTKPFDFNNDKIEHDTTLYAKWSTKAYNVGFNLNGHGDEIAGFTVGDGALIASAGQKIDNPKADGAKFLGWSLDTPSANAADYVDPNAVVVLRNVTFVANWDEGKYTVAFKGNTENAIVPETSRADVKYNEKITAPKRPSAPGKVFAGWAKDSEGTEPFNFNEDTITDNTTLYAQWSDNSYDVRFDMNGHGEQIKGFSVGYGTMIGSERVIKNPTEEGYKFEGWTEDGVIKNVNAYIVESDVTFVAKWAPKRFDVTFDSNTSDTSVANMPNSISDVKYGSKLNAQTIPTRTDYVFAGWTTDKAGEKPFEFGNDTIKDTTVLYAQWNTKPVTASFDMKNYGEEIGAVTVASGTVLGTATLIQKPEEEGMIFEGWTVNVPKTTGNDYVDPNATKITEDVTFVANWAPATCKVIFNENTTAENLKNMPKDILKAAYGKTINAPTEIPTADGVVFAGWTSDEAGKEPFNFNEKKITKNTTLFAQWSKEPVTAGFDLKGHGAEIGAITVGKGTVLGTAVVINRPEEEGMQFDGWTVNEPKMETTSYVDPNATAITEDVTFVANWTQKTYNVVFNENTFATVKDMPKDKADVKYNAKVTVKSVPKADGKTFAGWYTEPECENVFDFNADTITDDTTLYAKWTDKSYNVVFDMKGHGEQIQSLTVGYNTLLGSVMLINRPEEAGQKFTGWKADGNNVNPNAHKVTDDITFVAQWTPEKYKVVFNANTDAEVDETTIPATKEDVLYDQKITVKKTPQAEGKTFAGWYKEAECKNVFDFNTDTITDDTTLYAKWSDKSYNVVFDMNGHGEQIQSMTVGYGTLLGSVMLIEKPTAPGQKFSGWKAGTADVNPNAVVIENDVTFVAQWTEDKYKVVFNKNTDATVQGMPDKKDNIKYNQKITTTDVPTTDGKTFAGWAKDPDGDKPFNFETDTITEDTTLYAQWSEDKCKVSFDMQGSGSEISAVEVGYGTLLGSAQLIERPEAEGMIFLGWTKNKAAEGTAPKYVNPNGTTITEDVVFVANWSKEELNVTYNANTTDTVKNLPNADKVEYGKTLTAPNVHEMSRDGYVFAGWSSDQAGKEPFDFNGTKITDDTTLFAQWSLTYHNVSFELNGHGSAITAIKVGDGAILGSVKTIYEPKEEGMVFLGWSVNTPSDKKTDYVVINNEKIKGDVTYVANWKQETVNVEYNANTTDTVANLPDAEKVAYGKTLTAPNVHEMSRDGYVFAGWSNDQAGKEPFDFNGTELKNDTTLFAQWSKEPVDVTFNMNGHGQQIKGLTVGYGTVLGSVTAIEKPAEAGMIFDGWTKDEPKTKKTEFVDPNAEKIEDDVIFVANWTPETYKVVFNANTDAEVDEATMPATKEGILYDQKITVKKAPQAEGKTFAGWFTEPECENAFNFNEDTITDNTTLYAKWSDKSYKVAFDMSGHGTQLPTLTVGYGTVLGSVTLIGNPTEAGYSFEGWTLNDNDVNPNEKIIKKDVTFVANWEIAEYSVNLNYNGGTPGEDAPADVEYGKAFDKPADPTKEGYDFAGWYTNSALTDKYEWSTPATADLELYAKWSPKEYKVTFDMAGHGEQVEPQFVEYGNLIDEPVNPTAVGYTFAGWKMGDVEWKFHNEDFPVTSNVKLTAQWTPKTYTVKFDANTTKAVKAETIPVTRENSVEYNTLITAPAKIPAQTNGEETFAGWYKEKECENAFDFNTDKITDNTTLYAAWSTVNHKVSFKMNGYGEPVEGLDAIGHGTLLGSVMTVENPTAEGKVFVRWTMNGGAEGVDPNAQVITKDTEFTAVWADEECEVAYNSNAAGVTAPAGETVAYGTRVTAPNVSAMTRDGYAFAGWYTEPECENAFDFNADKITKNTTLYAKWSAKGYDVSFDMKGHGNQIQGMTVGYDTMISSVRAINNPSEKGMIFKGWKEAGKGTAHVNVNGYKVKDNVTFVADWEAETCIVKYDANTTDEVENFPEGGTVDYGTVITAPDITNMDREGYTFAGWATDVNGENPYDFNTRRIEANTTLYAQWSKKSCNVAFDMNGHGTQINPMTVGYGTLLGSAATIADPEAAGYEFTGWKMAFLFTSVDVNPNEYVVTKDVTFVAQWVVAECSVNLNYNGGTPGEDAPADVEYGEAFDKPADPTKEGYDFAGWYTDSELTDRYEWSTPATDDIELYAKWTKQKFTVSFDMMHHGEQIATQVVDYNGKALRPDAPVAEGYDFAGWYANDSFATETLYDFATPVTEDLVLIAKWDAKNYRANLNFNGGKAKELVGPAKYGHAFNKPADPEKTGYDFAGWYTDSKLTNLYEWNTPATDDIELYAKWEKKSYAIIFDMAGHGEQVATQAVEYGGYATQPVAPEETGYTFGGWTAEDGTPWSFEKNEVKANHTLHAVWTAKTYSVVFHQNTTATGLQNMPSDIDDVEYGKLLTAPDEIPTVDGLTFAGWTIDKAGKIPFLFNVNRITDDTTLYAQWTENAYTVSFEMNGYGTAIDPITLGYGTKLASVRVIEDPTAEGKNFLGWSVGKETVDANLYVDPNNANITEDLVFVANWDTKVYDLNLNYNGGRATETVAQKAEHGNAFDKPQDPVRTGYTFDGWYRDSGLTDKYDWSVAATGNLELYAKWTKNTYTVSFDMSGHGAQVADQTVEYGEKADEPTDPREAGYIFAGWYEEGAMYGKDAKAFEFTETPITQNIKLTAKWIPRTYSVTLNYNGGEAEEKAPADVAYGQAFDKPANPTREGFGFAGWYTDSKLTYEYDWSTPATKDITLYAKWNEKVYTVAFDMSGHGSQVPTQTVVHGGYANQPVAPTAEGYEFDGWKTTNRGWLHLHDRTWSFEDDEVTQDHTLVAQWTAKEYTVTFNKNVDGDLQDKVENMPHRIDDAKYDELIIAPKQIPTLEGKTFAGWTTDPAGYYPFDFNTMKITDNINLYAQWSDKGYNVSFDMNGHGEAIDTIAVGYGTLLASAKVIEQPEEYGYTFTGWTVKTKIHEYVPVEYDKPVNPNEVVIEKDTLFTANWEINVYDLNLNYNGGKATETVAQKAEHGQAFDKPQDPVRIGYTFDGWYRDSGLTDKYDWSVPAIGNLELYAKWTKNTYIASFDMSQHGTQVDDQIVEFGGKINEPADPVEEGYEFVGWFDEDGNEWTFTEDRITENVKLTAKWIAKKYSVNLNYNGGAATEAAPAKVLYKEKFNKPSDPVREGYEFAGWYVNSELTDKYEWSTPATSNIELYAKWTKKTYTIKFDMAGHGDQIATQTVEYGDYASQPVAPTAKGYEFEGWKTTNRGWLHLHDRTWSFEDDEVTQDHTLVAQWTAKEYTVTFNKNVDGDLQHDVENMPQRIDNAKYDELIIAPKQIPTLEGKTFAGWTKDPAGNYPFDFNTMKITDNINLYAQWSDKSYNVAFDMNGHGEAIDTIAVGYNTLLGAAKTIEKPEAYGYDFLGWKVHVKDEKGQWTWKPDKIVNANEETIKNDTVFVAQWKIKTYSVNLNYNGGVPTEAEPADVEHGQRFDKPSDPVRKGYEFAGWYTNSELTDKYEWSTQVTGNLELYAKWDTKMLTVRFDMDGHGNQVPSQSVAYGAKIDEPETPAAEGYTFEGWFAEDGSQWIFDEDTVTQNMKLTAKWSAKEYSVVYEYNGGTPGSTEPTTAKYGEMFEKPADPTKEDPDDGTQYTFVGWYTDAACTDYYDWSTPVTGNIRLFAKWVIKQYVVSFEMGGHGEAIPPQVVNKGETVDEPMDPTAPGCKFLGWYTDRNYSEEYDFSTQVEKNIKLYAKWDVYTYTMKFDGCGGTVSTTTETAKYGELFEQPADPVREHYKFLGWYTEKAYVNLYEWATPAEKDLTLYAKWDVDTHNVTFDVDGTLLGEEDEVHGVTPIPGQRVAYGSFATRPENPELAGWRFKGWVEDNEEGKFFSFESTPIVDDIELHAVWEKADDADDNKYSVNFDANGGAFFNEETGRFDLTGKTVMVDKDAGKSYAVDPGEGNKLYDEWIRHLNWHEDPTAEDPNPEFLGWYTDRVGGTRWIEGTRITEDTTYYAHWTNPAKVNTEPGIVQDSEYNAEYQELVIPGTTDPRNVIMYSIGTADQTDYDKWSPAVPTAKDAGTYPIFYYVKGDLYDKEREYMDGDEKHTTNSPTYFLGYATITPKEVGLKWGQDIFTFDGYKHVPPVSLTGVYSCDQCTVKVSGAQSKVGSYMATAYGLSNSNYKLPENCKKSFKIIKSILLAQATHRTKTTSTVSWNKVSGADKYVIYGAKCNKHGKVNKMKKLGTVGAGYSKRVMRGLEKYVQYKFYVKAYRSGKEIAKSNVAHCITYNTNKKMRVANVQSITAKTKKLTVKASGNPGGVVAVYKVYQNKKRLDNSHARAYRYLTSNPYVAKVSSVGTVTGLHKGTATIYIQAVNGMWCSVKVTVK